MNASLSSPNPELTPQVLVELRAQLEQTRTHLTRQIATRRREEGADDTPEQNIDTDLRGDRGDDSIDLQAWDTTEQGVLDLQGQLAEVEHALAKLAAGTYGIGERSGRPIPLARLRVLPEARDDVVNEARFERDQGDTE